MDVKKILKEGMFWGFVVFLINIIVSLLFSWNELYSDLFYSLNIISYELSYVITDFIGTGGEIDFIISTLLLFLILLIYHVIFVQTVLFVYTLVKEKNIFPYSKNLKPFGRGMLVGFIVGIVKITFLIFALIIGFISLIKFNHSYLRDLSLAITDYLRYDSTGLVILGFIDIISIILLFSIMGGVIGLILNKIKK